MAGQILYPSKNNGTPLCYGLAHATKALYRDMQGYARAKWLIHVSDAQLSFSQDDSAAAVSNIESGNRVELLMYL